VNYRSFVVSALSSLSIPVRHLTYTGTATTYCKFQRYNLQGETYAEGKERSTGHYVQVDIFSPTDATELGDTAQALLIAAGAIRIGGQSLYEDDTKLYHDSRDYLIEEI